MELVDAGSALRIGFVTAPPCDAWLFTLSGQWERCLVRVNEFGSPRWLTLVGATDGTAPGAFGSPIVTADGRAVGIVSVGTLAIGKVELEQNGQPRLASELPVWLRAELNVDRERDARKG